MEKLKIGESLLKNGLKMYLEKIPSIYGLIKKDEKFFTIAFYYKNVFQKEYKKDSMSEAKVKLSVLIKNAHKQYIKLENENMIIKFSDFKINEYVKYALLPKELRNKNILYHSTEFDNFKKIMKDNILYGTVNYDYGISTSRNKHYGFGRYENEDSDWNIEVGHDSGDIQFLLDKDLLKNNYKIKAFDWEEWKTTTPKTKEYNDFHQNEDKILASKVKNIRKYIIGIQIIHNDDILELFKDWYSDNNFDFKYIYDENWKNITNEI